MVCASDLSKTVFKRNMLQGLPHPVKRVFLQCLGPYLPAKNKRCLRVPQVFLGNAPFLNHRVSATWRSDLVGWGRPPGTAGRREGGSTCRPGDQGGGWGAGREWRKAEKGACRLRLTQVQGGTLKVQAPPSH